MKQSLKNCYRFKFNPSQWLKQKKIATLTYTDTKVPSLVEQLTGEQIKGSWWGHPQAHFIYNTYQSLVETKTVLTMKLVKGKVTFIHKDLWVSLFSAVSDQKWQKSALYRLSLLGRAILELVEQKGAVLCALSDLPFNKPYCDIKKA